MDPVEWVVKAFGEQIRRYMTPAAAKGICMRMTKAIRDRSCSEDDYIRVLLEHLASAWMLIPSLLCLCFDHHQHSHSLGLGQGGVGVGSAAEYGKPLYGGSAGQVGMQGFMGLGSQSSGVNPSSAAGGPRTASSPESAYKPYGSKDVGVTSGRGGSVQQQSQVQGQPQSQSQGQSTPGGPQGQGFYGSNRFGSGVAGVGAGVGGPSRVPTPSAPPAPWILPGQ
ncbi:hypothetical protein NMY22_g11848 [Coprinellus aureogranulatus]|nr:hypothetical protein NMY22_g11848 [Coprinellus aureogranulatus]